ncbi:MAG TPA: hypothetical protein EYP48_02980, partial [Ignisphaera sp.]|nr:hypothetical protein [Ignisphaera sp.]
MPREELEPFFSPRSIAVVGASRDPSKAGYQIVLNLKAKFRGKIYPINPYADEILGLKCFKSVSEVPDHIDLAVISVPADTVLKVVEECGLKGIRRVIVISAGFREIGPEGAERERKLIEIAKKYNIRVLGPNCVGVYVPK